MADVDLYPLNIRGPVGGQNYITFARMFTLDGQLYIARSRDRGRTVSEVTIHPIPDEEPTRPGKSAKWGDFAYTGCGCTNSWRIHTKEALAAMVKVTT